MQIACRLGHKHIVKWLLKKGEDATTSAVMEEETLTGYMLYNTNDNENSYEEGSVEWHVYQSATQERAKLLEYIKRECANCGKKAIADWRMSKGVKLLKCSRCVGVFYCSCSCQQEDWPEHRAEGCDY